MAKFEGIRIFDACRGGIEIAPGKQNIFKSTDALVEGSSLIVRIPMTHAGIRTKNMGFYLPSKMMKAGKTFTDDFEKPVLVGHGDHGFFSSGDDPEPIGRVKAANYVDISAEWLKKDIKLATLYKQHFSKDEEESLGGGVGLANHVLKKYILKNKKSYQGLGYLDGILNIADQEAAQKILDGRFMTVSISVGAKDAYCNICSQNLVKDGPCDHRRGEEVDGVPMMVLLGDMFYDHVAIVNNPADPFAAKFELFNGNDSTELPGVDALSKDALEVAARCFVYYNMDNIEPLYTEEKINIVQVSDNVGGIVQAMAKPIKKDETQVADQTIPNPVVADAPTGDTSTDTTQTTDQTDPTPVTTDAQDNADPQDAPTTDVNSPQENTDPEDELKPFVDLIRDKLEVPVEDLRFCAEFFCEAAKTDSTDQEFHQEVSDALGISEGEYSEDKIDEHIDSFKKLYESLIPYEELINEEDNYKHFEEELEEDAKLSPEKRKALPGSAFCGPNRSFPVNDCAHYTAALRLLNRAKVGVATKTRVRSCILRRGKKLECSSSKGKDDTDLDTKNPAWDNGSGNQQLMDINDAELKTKLKEFRDELLRRGLADSCTSCVEHKQQVELLNSQLNSAHEEIKELTDDNGKIENLYRDQLAERAVDLKILSGTSIEDRDTEIEKYKEREIVSLTDTVKDLTENFNIADAAAKLNDGISRDPTEQVDNPVLQDNSTENSPESDNSKKEDEQKEKIRAIYDAYEFYLRTQGKAFADRYIAGCKAKGLIPE